MKIASMMLRLLILGLGCLLASFASAAPAPFDLAGPNLQVVVSRGPQILPLSEVPNLAEGDKLWIRADFPQSQSANYLMVAVFLSGSTNPPPENWFFPCKTWLAECKRSGLSVTVPKGAQQMLIFLAPATSGDFSTLIGAVRGRPGAFVRASQDLNQAALDRSRLERYVSAVRVLDSTSPASLRETAPLLARSLAIKVKDECLDRLPELQAPCLMQGQEALILNDGHSVSIAQALTESPATDLLMQASYTPQAGYGYYSPYISSVVDIIRIFDSFGTAQYQYIPALGLPSGDSLALTLNTPPSFNNPKSVLVAAMPAIERAQNPPLHAVDPDALYCASRTRLVLPVDGAPLVFSTRYAHDMRLTVTTADNKNIDLPAHADATKGGYVVDTSRLNADALGDSVRAALRGYWGFEPYDGPTFQLRNAHGRTWTVADDDADSLIVGRQDTIHIHADSASCVDRVMLRDPSGKELNVDWKKIRPGELELALPMQSAQPGALTLAVSQAGIAQPQLIPIQAFSEAGRLDSFSIHSGDAQGTLKGTRLDLVASVKLGGVTFVPGLLATSHGSDTLTVTAQDAVAAAALAPASSSPAKVMLKDGRSYKLGALIDTPRPRAQLIGKSVQLSQSSVPSNIQLATQDELPQDATLTFSLRSVSPASFTGDATVEVATVSGSRSTSLSFADGSLMLEDAHVAVAVLHPLTTLGPSAFGPLQFRMVAGGVAGDWMPLATLVRLPSLSSLKCPADAKLDCRLSGGALFLLDSLSGNAQFLPFAPVPDGYTGASIAAPRPQEGRLYVKLRDDPSIVSPVSLDVEAIPDPAEKAAGGNKGDGAALSSPVRQ